MILQQINVGFEIGYILAHLDIVYEVVNDNFHTRSSLCLHVADYLIKTGSK